MFIEKLAQKNDSHKRRLYYFSSARKAFFAYLRSLLQNSGKTVLLPAYIGWSPREGSGVFDPIDELRLSCDCYRVDSSLYIDLDHLKSLLQSGQIGLLVIIHYFGYVDPHYKNIVNLAKEFNVPVLEDQAHSFFTDIIGGVSGRCCDASIYSLHKMFPFSEGGILALNNSSHVEISHGSFNDHLPWFEYDFYAISRIRRDNAKELAKRLESHHDKVKPLRTDTEPFAVPQTFPVVIQNESRDKLYELMNEAGYGVVSLYHTMIRQISYDRFPESHWLSKRIMNLPVHQDVSLEQIDPMVQTLISFINQLK